MTKNMIKKLIADESSAHARLDIFLVEKLDVSRSQAQKMIASGEIKINDLIPSKSGERLSAGDTISIAPIKIAAKKPTAANPRVKKFTIKDIKIIKKTTDYLIVEKPSGMLTHSTAKNESDSLAALLAKKFPELNKVGEDSARPGIVHRLDKEASGLLVVARTPASFESLKNQFKNRTIQKEYLVLVHGQVAKDWGQINFPIDRGDDDRMVSLPSTVRGLAREDGKSALTEFLVEKRFVNFTLLRVTLHTGRMHQIRVHMLAYNHPVISDPMYFQKKRPDKWDKQCPRLFLHCVKLGFDDLSQGHQTFESELPAELTNFLTLLK